MELPQFIQNGGYWEVQSWDLPECFLHCFSYVFFFPKMTLQRNSTRGTVLKMGLRLTWDSRGRKKKWPHVQSLISTKCQKCDEYMYLKTSSIAINLQIQVLLFQKTMNSDYVITPIKRKGYYINYDLLYHGYFACFQLLKKWQPKNQKWQAENNILDCQNKFWWHSKYFFYFMPWWWWWS